MRFLSRMRHLSTPQLFCSCDLSLYGKVWTCKEEWYVRTLKSNEVFHDQFFFLCHPLLRKTEEAMRSVQMPRHALMELSGALSHSKHPVLIVFTDAVRQVQS